MEMKTLLFEKPGKANTTPTLEIAKERALALGIDQIVVASSHGDTASQAHELLSPLGIEVIAVTIGQSCEDKGWCITDEERQTLTELGVTVHTGVHTLSGLVGDSFAEKHGGYGPERVVRDTLYAFCQGMKVCVECVLMAAEAGLLDMTKEVVAVAGTDEGADTAIVCKPAYPRTFHQLGILEVLAKPR
jgi:hypothetical protein